MSFTYDDAPGDETHVSVNHKKLWEEVKPGDTLLLSDGLVGLVVDEVAQLGERLDTAQLAKLARFFAVARAWMIVACGAALIAIKETYELAHHHHWGATGFWLLVLIAAVGVAATNAATWKKPGRAARGL